MLRLYTRTLAATFVAGLMALPAAAQTKVNIGYGFTGDTLSAHVAKAEGIFAKHGLDVTLTPVAGASALMAGLFSGSLQIIMSNPAQLLTGVNGGLDLIVVSGGARTTKDTSPPALVVRKDVAYSEPKDLIGKKVAVAGFDSGTYMVFRKWLTVKGVDGTKVDFVEGAMPTLGDLLKSGRVDAVTIVEPFLAKIVADGLGRVVAKYFTDVIPDQPSIFWAGARDWAGKNKEVVLAFRASLKDATALIRSNPQRAKEIELAVFKSNGAILPLSSEVVTPADLEVYYQIGKDLKLYDKQIDTSALIFKE